MCGNESVGGRGDCCDTQPTNGAEFIASMRVMKFTDQIETHGKGEGGVGIGMARQTGRRSSTWVRAWGANDELDGGEIVGCWSGRKVG